MTSDINEIFEAELQKYHQGNVGSKNEKVIKIVMVDDLKSISSSMKRELMFVSKNTEGYRFNIIDFQDSEVALKFLEANQPDLLISDIKMPFLTGDKLVEEVKKFYPDLPIIVVTGYATRDNILSVYKSDKNSIILTKPWEPKRLVQALNKLLELDLIWPE
ncbi:response regulator [Leptospira ilyithenensis]|uniref:Response regulator n=1 Tax=Leptospira ilyithenensis TaxID=2484901 RepID=A0A4R9LNK1_9LEPT|nr:response regulator [Leptospira ilyithenensis]TGN10408.1 response regulator [Leptospira ilyithenensis]